MCGASFERKKTVLTSHTRKNHGTQWNCDNCDFQGSTRAILLKPLQERPSSKQAPEARIRTSWYPRSYHDLMSHRKEVHPSNQICRYYIKGECNFSADECWYAHKDQTNISQEISSSKECFVYKNSFPTKYDLMEHKK